MSDSSGQQADVSPESVATTLLSNTSESQNGEVQMSDDAPSLQWDNADLTSVLLQRDLCEHIVRYTIPNNTINDLCTSNTSA